MKIAQFVQPLSCKAQRLQTEQVQVAHPAAVHFADARSSCWQISMTRHGCARNALTRSMAHSLREYCRVFRTGIADARCSSLKEETMHKQAKILATVIFAAMVLQGCNQQADTTAKAQADNAKAQADIAKAEADGQKKIIDAQAKLDQVVAQNNKDVVGAQTDAQEQAASNPNAPPPAAGADVAKARSDAEKKVADAQYDVDKAKAEAVKQVAEARCKTLVGGANESCMAAAKTNYESALAAAKSKSDAAHASHQ